MTLRPDAAVMLKEARERSGLTQRALARRAGTTQSVVARIESGETSPGWDTLQTLLRAAGFDLDAALVPRTTGRTHMLADVKRILRLTPEDRIREVAAVDRFVSSARRV